MTFESWSYGTDQTPLKQPVNRREWGLARHKTHCFQGVCDVQWCVIAIHWSWWVSCKCPMTLFKRFSCLVWYPHLSAASLSCIFSENDFYGSHLHMMRWGLFEQWQRSDMDGMPRQETGSHWRLLPVDLFTQADKVLSKSTFSIASSMCMNPIRIGWSSVQEIGGVWQINRAQSTPWSNGHGHCWFGPPWFTIKTT